MGRITDLQDEVSRRKNHVTQLDHQIHTLNENISTLTKELELKGKEVLKIRSEANQQIRYDPAWTGYRPLKLDPRVNRKLERALFSGAGTARKQHCLTVMSFTFESACYPALVRVASAVFHVTFCLCLLKY